MTQGVSVVCSVSGPVYPRPLRHRKDSEKVQTPSVVVPLGESWSLLLPVTNQVPGTEKEIVGFFLFESQTPSRPLGWKIFGTS